jgi:hypothetical protein
MMLFFGIRVSKVVATMALAWGSLFSHSRTPIPPEAGLRSGVSFFISSAAALRVSGRLILQM